MTKKHLCLFAAITLMAGCAPEPMNTAMNAYPTGGASPIQTLSHLAAISNPNAALSANQPQQMLTAVATNMIQQAMNPVPTPTTNNANASGGYVVKKGDTLFSIMRATGVNWKKLIQINGLTGPNYVIQPGQTIKLS